MRRHLGFLLCITLGAAACGKDNTPTEPSPTFTPPSAVATPTPAPMSILGVAPRAVPFGIQTEITVAGSGFPFPLQVFFRSGQHSLELTVSSLSGTTIKAMANVTTLSGFPPGLADLEVVAPTTGQRVVCPAWISVSQ